jgi:Restriction endonuclease
VAKQLDQREVDEFIAFLPCAAEYHFPFRVSVARGDGGAIPYGRVRIDSYYHWDGGGGRTDLHDVLGILWAASLRASGAASTSLWGYTGWTGRPELESRILFFDQPYVSALSVHNLAAVEARIKAHTAWAAHDLLKAMRFFPSGRQRATWQDEAPPPWLSQIEPLVGSPDTGIWITRRRPDYSYFVTPDNTVSIARFEPALRKSLVHAFAFWRPEASECMGHYVLRSNDLENCVPVAVAERATEIIARVEGRSKARWRGPAQMPDTPDIVMIPLETHCVFIGKRAMVAMAAPCGKREFNAARLRWSKQTADLASIFRADTAWDWASPVDPARMEKLVEELLTEEPGLHWVRPTGPSFERDQGRDLVATWLTPPGLNQTMTHEATSEPVFARKIVVQVKTRNRTVGKSDVQDVRDMLERHDAEGLLLVADPVWSNDLFNYLETLARKGAWIGLWGRADIEARLRRHPFIASQFTDVVLQRRDQPGAAAT